MGECELTNNEYRSFGWGDDNILELTEIVTHLCEH